MRGPHDVGGLDFGPIDPEEYSLTFWELQIDAIRAVIGSKGIVSTHENRRTIEQFGHEIYDKLSYYERWTAALQRQMVDKGILRNRMATTGYGYSNPVALNGTEFGRALNRRVEIHPY